MKEVLFPYGKEKLSYQFEDSELAGVLVSHIEEYEPELSGEELIKAALKAPVGSEPLCELAKGKQLVKKEEIKIVAIPDGVSVMVRKEASK